MRLPKKKAVKAAVAGLAASAMLLTAMPAYAGIGSGGGGVHGGGSGSDPCGGAAAGKAEKAPCRPPVIMRKSLHRSRLFQIK